MTGRIGYIIGGDQYKMKIQDSPINIHLKKNSRWPQKCINPAQGSMPLPVPMSGEGSWRRASESYLSVPAPPGLREYAPPSQGERPVLCLGQVLKVIEMTRAAPS